MKIKEKRTLLDESISKPRTPYWRFSTEFLRSLIPSLRNLRAEISQCLELVLPRKKTSTYIQKSVRKHCDEDKKDVKKGETVLNPMITK